MILDEVERRMQTGELAGLTVFRSGRRWQANARWEDSDGWCVGYGDTLDTALQTALASKPEDEEDLIG